jgi:UDP-glucose 4-epimerase
MVEHILKDVAAAEGLAFAAPRYFNVAGCAPDGTIGEDHRPETHLIPVLLQVAMGKKSHVDLFGTDYPTKDGTCVRDYIHVWDLVEAHLVLLENVKPGQGIFYNLGVGNGYSNREIIASVERVTGKKLVVKESPRRPGDPPELWASPTKIKNELGWSAKFTKLDDIVKTAWNWFSKNPNGYDK